MHKKQIIARRKDRSVICLQKTLTQILQIAKEHHHTLIFLPPYSLELNSIEKVWNILKSIILKVIHLFDSLDDVIHFAFQVLWL